MHSIYNITENSDSVDNLISDFDKAVTDMLDKHAPLKENQVTG